MAATKFEPSTLRGLGADNAMKFEGSWRRLSTRSLDAHVAQHDLIVRRQQVMQGSKKSGCMLPSMVG